MLLKAVLLIDGGPIVVITALLLKGELNLAYYSFACISIIVSTVFFIIPFLKNMEALTRYVSDLADDKKVETPDLKLIGEIGPLSAAIRRLHRSMEKKRQEMDSILSEREILVDTIPDLLIMVDRSISIVRTNSSARLRFGQSLAAKPLSEIIDDDNLARSIAEVMSDFKGRETEIYVPEPINSYFRAKIERFPSHSRGGIAAIITLHDITELKRTEQMRADFVANASHEIRTPLASLIGFIETLQGPAKNDTQAMEQFLAIMADQAARMRKLVNDLLSLSKIEMSVNSLPTGKVRVPDMLAQVRKNTEWQAKKKNVQIIIEADENLPAIRGDESELQQVVQNLVENSLKYGNSDSEVRVNARISEKFPRDRNFLGHKSVMMISVTDQGEGIPQEHLTRLTERFYRVNTVRSRKIGGTGLGLAIVKHIVNRHRGAFHIDSVVGKGSTFTVYLPISG